MNPSRTKDFSPLLALVCAVAAIAMSGPFQSMAYWGSGLTWYWTGVGFTYLLWAAGVTLLVIAVMRRLRAETLPVFGPPIVEMLTAVLLVLGLLWTTFVIIAGMG